MEEKFRLSKKEKIYELINQLQRTILFEQNFSFVHDEFLKSFPKLPRNDFDFESGLCLPNLRFIESPLLVENSEADLELLSRIKQTMVARLKSGGKLLDTWDK